ncbi:MAG: PfkB family carbohydrate kinase [Pirellulaceae bacterium]
MTKRLIVGIGEALVDVLPSGEVVGGAPLNFSIRAAELGSVTGCSVALLTRIGADSRGEKILERLRDSHLDTCGVQVDSRLQTGYVDVSLESGQPNYTIGENVAWDAIAFDELAVDLAQRCNTLCFGTLAQRHTTTRETLKQFLDVAREAVKILDINFRRPLPTVDIIAQSLSAADVLKCNEDELLQLAEWLRLAERQQATEIASELQQQFELRCVFWTRGAAGCRWQSGHDIVDAQVPQLPAADNADSVGAGDAAAAALAIGLTLDWSPERIVRVANQCGAFAASQRGPTTPLPEEMLAAIA